MTPIHTLSDSELNELIRINKGTIEISARTDGYWINAAQTNVMYIPDYTHDWRLCGELLEEIGHNSSVVNCQADHTGYYCYVRKYPTSTARLIMTHSNTSLCRAICEAYAEWKGL